MMVQFVLLALLFDAGRRSIEHMTSSRPRRGFTNLGSGRETSMLCIDRLNAHYRSVDVHYLRLSPISI